MRIPTLLVALLLFSCETPSVPEAQRVAPSVERIQAPLDASQDAAEQIRGLLSKAQDDLAQRRIEALTFKSEIEKWRKEGMTKDEELSKVWEELNKQTTRNLFLEQSLDETQVVVSELEASLASAREATANAMIVAQQKDDEAEGLRGANDSLNAELDKANKKLAKAEVYRFWVIAIIVGLCIVMALREIIPIAMKYFKPL